MPDDLERLRKRIEDGVEAAEELQRILHQRERRARGEQKKRFRLIKGGLVGAVIWAGVEWLRNGRRIAAALLAAGVTMTGATIAEYPGSPGADPPVITQPPQTEPTKKPKAKPSPALTPQRTSPPRTPMMISPPPAARSSPPSTKPTATKEPAPMPSPTKKPTELVSLPVSLPAAIPVTPSVPVTVTRCTINLLGIRVCLPLG